MSKAASVQQPTFQLNVQYSILVTARSNKVLLMIQIFHEAQILLNNSVSVKRTDFVIQDNLLQSLQIQENKSTAKTINLNKLNSFTITKQNYQIACCLLVSTCLTRKFRFDLQFTFTDSYCGTNAPMNLLLIEITNVAFITRDPTAFEFSQIKVYYSENKINVLDTRSQKYNKCCLLFRIQLLPISTILQHCKVELVFVVFLCGSVNYGCMFGFSKQINNSKKMKMKTILPSFLSPLRTQDLLFSQSKLVANIRLKLKYYFLLQLQKEAPL
ncbi:Hypothetical_protein [Hexamita inflata]|uniref:Hypothetical_protein n=1 Tax=Hexamita inflata TaxID=28002 RepID=A0AA86TNT9_9EUKA|nr:Hypothetical protein HINF_LOCUS11759 [Hexamita inflata]